MLTNPATLSRRRLSIGSHRALIIVVACLAVLVQFAINPSMSRADSSTTNPATLTIVGTSDVQDSGLFPNVLKPDFEKFYDSTHAVPITTTFLSQGTQPAITTAESGEASALLVHAASLENQFVGGGFSEEPFGRAIFYGDFVLLGPASDPAGVMSGSSPSHDAVAAFEKIAAAGALGHANFVSRNDNSGTNVEEHEIWARTNVPGCTVTDANGGGKTPSTTTSGDCPATPTPPAWYRATGAKQAQNVEITDTCNFPSGPHDCYTITDRGTFENLVSQPGALHDLQIVDNNNSASAPGGPALLTNSFHAYAINPDNPTIKASGNQLNLPGAEAFLNWLTSPGGQNDVNAYLSNVPGGSPFLKDAAPVLTTSKPLPTTIAAGKTLTIKGTLSNVVPGTPRLAGKPVSLLALRTSVAKANPSAPPVKVATTSTDGLGRFTLHYQPKANASYTLSTGQILQVENSTLKPVFGDLLAPTSKSLGRTRVKGSVTVHTLSAHDGLVTLKGSVGPAPTTAFARLHITASHGGHTTKLSRRLKAGKHNFVFHFRLHRGFTWRIRLTYVNDGQTNNSRSKARSVNVR